MRGTESVRVLLIEDSPEDAEFVRRSLSDELWDTRVVASLGEALQVLVEAPVEVVLLDLGLPDTQGFDGVDALLECHPDMAVVILSGNEQEETAIEALQRGAQDYLVKGSWTAPLLRRVLNYSIERQRLVLANQRLQMLDASTGLPNRGFFDKALDRAAAMAKRNRSDVGLVLIDVDRMTAVNDHWGHHAGDQLIEEVARRLGGRGADPTVFTFEVTESVFADPSSRAAEQLNALRQLGCRVAIDDFGTGYSALSQLQRLPLDVLKLDRSFVAESVKDRDAARLAKGIIALGQGLQLQVIAEGIETLEEWQFVVDSGCDVGQGYLLSRPLDESVAVGLVQDSEVREAQLRANR